MKKGLTELVFILDRSGSMSGLESDTIGGYNGMLEKQKKEAGDAVITTVLFDDQYELLHDRILLKGVRNISDKAFIPGNLNKFPGGRRRHGLYVQDHDHIFFRNHNISSKMQKHFSSLLKVLYNFTIYNIIQFSFHISADF